MHTLFTTYLVAAHEVADVPSQVEPSGQAVHTLFLRYFGAEHAIAAVIRVMGMCEQKRKCDHTMFLNEPLA